MEKVLTISIAAYNVEKFLSKTLDSLIINNMDLLEVLIVNDGSKDNTVKIAQEYVDRYPQTFKIIDKENGGYGSTINSGIKAATGKYFKQLDGDDWYKTENLDILCEKLKECEEDVIYTPYVIYNEVDESEKIKDVFNGEDFKSYLMEEAIEKVSNIIEMHSLIYKTELLRNNNIKIQEHCFYTDTEFAIYPLLYAENVKYINTCIYVYRVGREGQSMSKEGKKKHYKDHITVGNNILAKYKQTDFNNQPNMRTYIKKFLAKFLASGIGNYFFLFEPSKEKFQEIQEYDENILKMDKEIYNDMSQYSKMVNVIRKKNYFAYKMAYYLKKLKRF